MIAGEVVVGVVLAGGRSSRMGGGDKCLLPLGSGTVLDSVIRRLAPQVDALVLNANGDERRFSRFGLPVAADAIRDFAGPLAGVLTGMEWIRNQQSCAEWMISAPADTPFLPTDLVTTLFAAAPGMDVVMAASGGQSHPTVALWRLNLADRLRQALSQKHMRSMRGWVERCRYATAVFPIGGVDPFYNINRPNDLVEAERLARIISG